MSELKCFIRDIRDNKSLFFETVKEALIFFNELSPQDKKHNAVYLLEQNGNLVTDKAGLLFKYFSQTSRHKQTQILEHLKHSRQKENVTVNDLFEKEHY